jgi:hypothetical protein
MCFLIVGILLVGVFCTLSDTVSIVPDLIVDHAMETTIESDPSVTNQQSSEPFQPDSEPVPLIEPTIVSVLNVKTGQTRLRFKAGDFNHFPIRRGPTCYIKRMFQMLSIKELAQVDKVNQV